MRWRGLACHVRAMARTSITIVLQVDETVDTPVGTARLPEGTSRTFHGWVAFAEAIDALAGLTPTGGATAPAALPVLPSQDREVPSI
jgi:hypothetical protein